MTQPDYVCIYYTYITCVVDEIDHKIISYFNPPSTINRNSPVGESLSTVDIDRDQSTGLIHRWIGIDIQIDVGTISHH